MAKFKFSFVIPPELCMGCATCVVECRNDAIHENEARTAYEIDNEKCIRCSRCYRACPVQIIQKVTVESAA